MTGIAVIYCKAGCCFADLQKQNVYFLMTIIIKVYDMPIETEKQVVFRGCNVS